VAFAQVKLVELFVGQAWIMTCESIRRRVLGNDLFNMLGNFGDSSDSLPSQAEEGNFGEL
jgi:hypothetical protein